MKTERSVATIRADLGESIREITTHYPKNRSAIMPALYLAQEKYGSVDGYVYQAIAEILDVPEIYVFEVASFYTMYNRKEVGKFHIQLCTNVSCMLLGAYNVLDHLEQRLGIKAGETTSARYLQALTERVSNMKYLADVVAMLGSLDPVMAEVDK